MEYSNNKVRIIGELKSEFVFNHEVHSEKFYSGIVKVRRTSGTYDEINVTVSERLIMSSEYISGATVEIAGEYRSYNVLDEGKSRLRLTLFAREISLCDDNCKEHLNEIVLNGFVCKKPVYRITPLGRHITDMLIAVNRGYNKSDYIPVIMWGRNAVFAETLNVGDNVTLQGRIQSRDYEKTLADGKTVTKTAYEVSGNEISVKTPEGMI